MIPDKNYIQERFEYFNLLIFNNELPPLPIVLSKAHSFLGRLEYKTKKGWKNHTFNYLLKISIARDMHKDALDDVIIHEMIHYFITFKKIKDSSAHGKVFRSMMTDINNRFDRHIEISHRKTEDELLQDKRERIHCICLSQLQGGKLGITVCSENNQRKIDQLLPLFYNIQSREWFCSKDSFFNRFPHVRTAKIYKVTEELLKKIRKFDSLNVYRTN